MSQASMQPARDAPDVVIVERPDVNIIVSVPGKYVLASRRGASGDRREFACRAVRMSPHALVLAAPVTGTIGERVIAHIERFGKAEGKITRVMDRGFIMGIAASDDERAKLATKIRWLEDHKNHDQSEGRKHGRIVPRDPLSRLTFGDGTRLTCLVIDMSISGAAMRSCLS